MFYPYAEFRYIPRMIIEDWTMSGPEFIPKKHPKSQPAQQKRNAKKQKRKKK